MRTQVRDRLSLLAKCKNLKIDESRIFIRVRCPDDIMSEMKPRPQPRRPKREDFMSQEELQRERKKESIFGDDDSFFPSSSSSSSSPASRKLEGGGGPTSFSDMPEWFRKEQESLGIKVEDVDADDFDEEEARRAWEREARQQKADEYLKRRGDGISISDVLGREVCVALTSE
jgi:hypothetical protein